MLISSRLDCTPKTHFHKLSLDIKFMVYSIQNYGNTSGGNILFLV